jgi:hypothetical protein
LDVTGSGPKTDTATNVTLGKMVVVLGDAERAAIQTVHFAESVALGC